MPKRSWKMVPRVWGAKVALVAVVIAGCSGESLTGDNAADQAVQTGARWRSPVGNGFYDVEGGRLLLWYSVTKQLFALDMPNYVYAGPPENVKTTCWGSVDVALGTKNLTLVGDGNIDSADPGNPTPTCSIDVEVVSNGLNLVDHGRALGLFAKRADMALNNDYKRTDRADSKETYLSITASDDAQITLAATLDGDPGSNSVFDGVAKWEHQDLNLGMLIFGVSIASEIRPFFAMFREANGCRVGLIPTLLNGTYELDVVVDDACTSVLAGHYAPSR
jgi:hypothetical protein